jgi:hypothetical protein
MKDATSTPSKRLAGWGLKVQSARSRSQSGFLFDCILSLHCIQVDKDGLKLVGGTGEVSVARNLKFKRGDASLAVSMLCVRTFATTFTFDLRFSA